MILCMRVNMRAGVVLCGLIFNEVVDLCSCMAVCVVLCVGVV